MEPFKQFALDKQVVLGSLSSLEGLIRQLGELGLAVQDDLAKVESAVNAIAADVLRVALMGAFSDGKTSVAAAWLGHLLDNRTCQLGWHKSDQLHRW
jgi:hypothetical protein